MNEQYKSEALAAAHETALGLAEAGLMARRTMKVFDEMCLTPVEDMAPARIREIRMRENASQAVFARYLNVTAGLLVIALDPQRNKSPIGPGLQLLPGFLDRLRAIGTGLPHAALQPRVKQVTHRIAEHVQTVNGYRQTKTGPESQPWRLLHVFAPLPTE